MKLSNIINEKFVAAKEWYGGAYREIFQNPSVSELRSIDNPKEQYRVIVTPKGDILVWNSDGPLHRDGGKLAGLSSSEFNKSFPVTVHVKQNSFLLTGHSRQFYERHGIETKSELFKTLEDKVLGNKEFKRIFPNVDTFDDSYARLGLLKDR